MTDVTSLEQLVQQAWVDACQAWQTAWTAHARATRTLQEVQRKSHRAGMARLALSMPEANPVTLAITATILAGRGLLDGQPAVGVRERARGAPPGRPPG